jgi:hypothetical protein
VATVTPNDVGLKVWRTGDSAITLTQAGSTDASGAFRKMGSADLTSPGIHARAAVTLRGTPGEHVDLFKFGFIQLKFVTDDWAHYRGRAPADGSVFFAADRPPARHRQLCRDTTLAKPLIFYNGDQPINLLAPFVGHHAGFFPAGTAIPASGSIAFTVDYFDSPQRTFDLIRLNNTFGPPRPNFLYSLQTGAAYATMFAVQKGHGAPIHVLKTFQWNVRWRAHFGVDLAGHVVQLPRKSGDVIDMNVSHVVAGGPPDPRFQHFVTDPTLPSCNAVVQAAFAHPLLRASRKWKDWEVRHAEPSLYP